MTVTPVFLSLGSNLGDREANLRAAIKKLSAAGVQIKRESSRFETAPQYVTDQPWFLNCAVEAETEHTALQVLAGIGRIERELGRAREIPKGPRTVDIDILLFGVEVISTPELTVPHPQMLERRFVLEPLLEIAPDLRYPGTDELIRDFLQRVQHQDVRRVLP